MAPVIYLAILLASTTLLCVRLSHSYLLSGAGLICTWLHLQPLTTVSAGAIEYSHNLALLACIALSIPIHKTLSHVIARGGITGDACPILFVVSLMASQILFTAMSHLETGATSGSSVAVSAALRWMVALGAGYCAYTVYRQRCTEPMLIVGNSLLVATGLYSLLLGHPLSAASLMAYASPWCWLILMRTAGENHWTSRLLLTGLIAASPALTLLPRPMAAQLIGLPIIVAVVVCLSDILRYTDSQNAITRTIPIATLTVALAAMAVHLRF